MLWRENIENGQNQGEKDAGHKLVVVTQGIGIKKCIFIFLHLIYRFTFKINHFFALSEK